MNINFIINLALIVITFNLYSVANHEIFSLIKSNNIESVQQLIKQKANINIKNQDGYTPLHLAATGGNLNIAKLLINNGANINAKDQQDSTPLHAVQQLFARKDYEEIAKLLIEKGADFNAKNKSGNTPLHDAALFAKEEMIKLLLQAGADKNIKNNDGMIAASLTMYPEIEILINSYRRKSVKLLELQAAEVINKNRRAYNLSDVPENILEKITER